MAGRCADSALSGGNVLPSAEACLPPCWCCLEGPLRWPLPHPPGWPCPSCTRLHTGALAAGATVRSPASWQASQQLPKEEQEALPPHQHPSWEGQGHTGTEEGAADSAAPGWPLPQPQRAACPGLLATVPHGPLAGCCGSRCVARTVPGDGGWCWGRLPRASCQHPPRSAAEVAPQESAWVFGLLCVLSREMAIHRGGPCSTPDAQGAHPTLVTCHPAGIGRRLAS